MVTAAGRSTKSEVTLINIDKQLAHTHLKSNLLLSRNPFWKQSMVRACLHRALVSIDVNPTPYNAVAAHLLYAAGNNNV